MFDWFTYAFFGTRSSVALHLFYRDDPYSNANDYQPSGYSNGPEPHDTGYVNPMYKTKIQVGSQEPLPEQSDIAINQDDVVLTTDSWRHEQLKGPEV